MLELHRQNSRHSLRRTYVGIPQYSVLRVLRFSLDCLMLLLGARFSVMQRTNLPCRVVFPRSLSQKYIFYLTGEITAYEIGNVLVNTSIVNSSVYVGRTTN